MNQISNDKTKARARLRIWVVLSNWILNDVWWFRNWQFVLLCLWKMSKTWENNLPQPSDSDFTFPAALLWKRLPKNFRNNGIVCSDATTYKKTLWSQIWKKWARKVINVCYKIYLYFSFWKEQDQNYVANDFRKECLIFFVIVLCFSILRALCLISITNFMLNRVNFFACTVYTYEFFLSISGY